MNALTRPQDMAVSRNIYYIWRKMCKSMKLLGTENKSKT